MPLKVEKALQGALFHPACNRILQAGDFLAQAVRTEGRAGKEVEIHGFAMRESQCKGRPAAKDEAIRRTAKPVPQPLQGAGRNSVWKVANMAFMIAVPARPSTPRPGAQDVGEMPGIPASVRTVHASCTMTLAAGSPTIVSVIEGLVPNLQDPPGPVQGGIPVCCRFRPSFPGLGAARPH